MKFTAITKMVFLSLDFIDQLNDAMNDLMSENISAKYYEPYKITLLIKNATKNRSFFHFLCIHIEDLITLKSEHDIGFDIIGISECPLKLNKAPLSFIQIPGYNFEFTPPECNNGGIALYIKRDFLYSLFNF